MKLLALLILSNFIISTNAFAHGEDKYGPNKGYIKMPGSFHTEVIPANDGSYRVYLLDLFNKNPTVKDSTLVFQIKDAEVITVFDCKPVESSHFNCISKNKIKNKGQIILTTKRLGIQAKPTTYDLPLKLKNEKHDMSKMKM